jgi:hypothetical protein
MAGTGMVAAMLLNSPVASTGSIHLATGPLTMGFGTHNWYFGADGTLSLPQAFGNPSYPGIINSQYGIQLNHLYSSGRQKGAISIDNGGFGVRTGMADNDMFPGGSTWQFWPDGKITFPDGSELRIVTPPLSSTGTVGDIAGSLAYNSSSTYYCTASYVAPTYPTELFSVTNVGENTNTIKVLVANNPNYTIPQAGWTTVVNGTTMTLTAFSGMDIDGVNFDFLFDVGDGPLPSTATFTSNVLSAAPNIWVKQNWGTTGSW